MCYCVNIVETTSLYFRETGSSLPATRTLSGEAIVAMYRMSSFRTETFL